MARRAGGVAEDGAQVAGACGPRSFSLPLVLARFCCGGSLSPARCLVCQGWFDIPGILETDEVFLKFLCHERLAAVASSVIGEDVYVTDVRARTVYLHKQSASPVQFAYVIFGSFLVITGSG